MAQAIPIDQLSDRLLAYLRSELNDPALHYDTPLTPVPGGYEAFTYRFRLANAAPPLSNPLVLRLFRPYANPRQAHSEGAVLNALYAQGYPAPPVHFTSADTTLLGGGFMVMATITEAPELFGAACNIVGIVNFQTFLEQTKAYRRHLREAEYGPLSDPEFLKSISPLYKVDKIETPLFLAHGLNDPRVPVGEAMQVAVALKKRGVKVEELYFPDEGHGFAKEDNRLLYYNQLTKFFDEHLKK